MLFDIARGVNSLSNIKATRFTLPSAYQSSFDIAYTDGYTGFIGIATNTFWFLSYDSR